MLKLKLQNFGHLMGRADSLEKTLVLGKIEGRRGACMLSRFSHVQLFCDSTDYSTPGFSVHGIPQARILE